MRVKQHSRVDRVRASPEHPCGSPIHWCSRRSVFVFVLLSSADPRGAFPILVSSVPPQLASATGRPLTRHSGQLQPAPGPLQAPDPGPQLALPSETRQTSI